MRAPAPSSFPKYAKRAPPAKETMFEFCTDPSTLDTFRWFSCYLTNGAHFLFYQSFLVVFALLAVTAPTALAFGFAAAAASRSHDPAAVVAGQDLHRHGARRARHRLFPVLHPRPRPGDRIPAPLRRLPRLDRPDPAGRELHRLPRGADAAIGRAAMGA
jgi:hypothetical protein